MSRGPDPSERLTDLWRLGPSEVVALVGAGGKSSLMEALARDFEAEGALVVLTTTTKILPPEPGGRPLVTAPHLEGLLHALGGVAVGAFAGCSPVVGRGLTADGKVRGVPPEWVPALRDLPGVAAVLVEADGAVGRPLKAPAAYEPVVPACASLVVVIGGLDAQDARLDAEHVHRPELVSELVGISLGDPIPPEAVLRASVAGYVDRVPRHAGFLVFLNKADTHPPGPDVVAACEASGVEVWSGAVGVRLAGGVAGSRGCTEGPLRPEAADRKMRRLSRGDPHPPAVIPAAGLAARMGGPKILAALGAGTVVGRVVAALRESGVAREVVVVAGPDAEAVETAVVQENAATGPHGVIESLRVVRNDSPEEGMSSSLRVGLASLCHPPGVLVLLGDQPFVHPETLRRLVAEAAARPRAAAVGLAGGPGGAARPPVLLHRSLLPQILESRGDEGARKLLARYASSVVCVPGRADEELDVDRPEDLRLARRILTIGECLGGPAAPPDEAAGGAEEGWT